MVVIANNSVGDTMSPTNGTKGTSEDEDIEMKKVIPDSPPTTESKITMDLENHDEEVPHQKGAIAKFCETHGRVLRIIKWTIIVTFIYSYTIASIFINPNHSKKLIGLVIFGTACALLYCAYLFILSFHPPNYIEMIQNRFRWANMAAAIAVGLVFLGIIIYFIAVSDNRLRKVQALGGLVVYVLLCWLFSKDRKRVKWRGVLWGLGIQFTFALLILKTGPGRDLFDFIGTQTSIFLDYSKVGSRFVFGSVAIDGAGDKDLVTGTENIMNYQVWCFAVLPTVVFFSAFVSMLFHIGVLQVLIMGISKVMFYTMQTSVVESLNAAGNIFVGMTEAPLMIRPFLSHMTKSEIHAVMTGGFATIAGGVLAIYISMNIPAKHLIAASVMSCPAALAISKLVYPEIEQSKYTSGEDFVIPPLEDAKNFIEALKNGASVSIGLVANIVVMLICFISFYNVFETWFAYFALCVGWETTLTEFMAYIFVPFAWLLGIEESNCMAAGELLAQKLLINEYFAYLTLSGKIASGEVNERTEILMTYALCGFGNVASMGIQVGALSVMAPERKSDFSKMVFSSMLAGTVACQMTACIAGILLG